MESPTEKTAASTTRTPQKIQPASSLDAIHKRLLKTAEETTESRAERFQDQREREHQIERAERDGMFASYLASRGDRYKACRLASYEIYHDAQTPVVETLRAYATDMENNAADGRGIFLHGSSGTGKDHLLSAMARVAILRHGIGVEWISGQQLFGEIREAMDDESKASEASIIKRLTSPSVLILSDPAPTFGNVSSHQGNVLYRIIDERYNRRKATWVSINVSNRKEAEEKLGGPIVDRMAHDAVVLPCQWPSYRMRKGE
jgi:DNA replication protein DnaC